MLNTLTASLNLAIMVETSTDVTYMAHNAVKVLIALFLALLISNTAKVNFIFHSFGLVTAEYWLSTEFNVIDKVTSLKIACLELICKLIITIIIKASQVSDLTEPSTQGSKCLTRFCSSLCCQSQLELSSFWGLMK